MSIFSQFSTKFIWNNLKSKNSKYTAGINITIELLFIKIVLIHLLLFIILLFYSLVLLLISIQIIGN